MLLTGIAIGGCLGYLFVQYRNGQTYLSKTAVEQKYVHKAVHEQLRSDADLQYENLQEKIAAETELRSRISELSTEHRLLRERLQQQETEMKRLQEASVAQFERTAERLFREKSDRFTQQNKVQLDGILSPLKETAARLRAADRTPLPGRNKGPHHAAGRDQAPPNPESAHQYRG